MSQYSPCDALTWSEEETTVWRVAHASKEGLHGVVVEYAHVGRMLEHDEIKIESLKYKINEKEYKLTISYKYVFYLSGNLCFAACTGWVGGIGGSSSSSNSCGGGSKSGICSWLLSVRNQLYLVDVVDALVAG